MELSESIKELEHNWDNERTVVKNIKNTQHKIEDANVRADKAEASGDLDTTARIRYGEMQEYKTSLSKEKKKLQKFKKRSMKEEARQEDIADVVANWTGVPVTKMLESELKKLSRMESILKKRIIGQDEAVEHAVEAIKRSRVGINDPERPIGSFLFLGPTGVGKTELARQLADILFDDPKALIRIDMSEFKESHSISKLIGAPPGYVGHEEAGNLTEKVRHRPYSIVLFDEIEKAHPSLMDLLLQVLDHGMLVDAKGREINFKNTIVILTSNIGSKQIQSIKNIGFSNEVSGKNGMSYTNVKEIVLEEVKKSLKVEFINRLDDILVFRPLNEEAIRIIAHNQIEKLTQRLSEKNIKVRISREAEKKIAKLGYDPTFGARPLRRVIQDKILNPIAEKMVDTGVVEDAEAVVSLGKDNETFEVSLMIKKGRVNSRKKTVAYNK